LNEDSARRDEHGEGDLAEHRGQVIVLAVQQRAERDVDDGVDRFVQSHDDDCESMRCCNELQANGNDGERENAAARNTT
jgi:hypothetical protein